MSLPPRTYAAWADLLTQCSQGDDAVLDLLAQGQWTPDAGTAIRFANLLNTTYTARKQRWLDAFSRSQAAGPSLRSPQDFALFLRQTTANLRPLYRLVTLSALPADLGETLRTDLTQFVQSISDSLRDNVMKHGGNRREELLLALRGFGTPPTSSEHQRPTLPATGRRIIF
jgi:hypothetical protein